jgi:hypothetical protein
MKKRTIIPTPEDPGGGSEHAWLPLHQLAEAEITSESPMHPIEGALVPGKADGWRAETPGEQTIRLNFEEPRSMKHVRVVIEERERARTQQFVLRAASTPEGPWRELARQQFNFSPSGAVREQEDYEVSLPAVAVLELTIVPDISGGDARASLQQLRIAG